MPVCVGIMDSRHAKAGPPVKETIELQISTVELMALTQLSKYYGGTTMGWFHVERIHIDLFMAFMGSSISDVTSGSSDERLKHLFNTRFF